MVNPNFYDPTGQNTQGVGGYHTLAIKNAAGDQRLGYDMLMQYLTGSTDTGTGPFAGFLERTLAPIATSAINAVSMANGGQLPSNIDSLFQGIGDRLNNPGQGGNIYDYLSNLAQQAIGSKLGPGANVGYNELQQILSLLNPLTEFGMDNVTGSQFERQQGDTLRNAQQASYWDPLGQNKRKDWGDFFTNSPFYHQFYGATPTGAAAGAPPTRSSVVQNAANNYGQKPQTLAGGGGGGGLYTP